MFQVNLYTLEKRENSTKQPVGDQSAFSCQFKDGCGIINPTIQLNLGLTFNPSNFNYAYIPDFNRYYFIDEWFFENALWNARMSVDVLATYKYEIGESDLYALRSANQYDGAISDSMYPTKTSFTYFKQSHAIFVQSILFGTFVIGVVSPKTNFGSIAYYALSRPQMRSLVQYLLDDSTLQAQGFLDMDASLPLQKALMDPLSFIKSCVYVPCSLADIDPDYLNHYTNIEIWDWNTSVKGLLITESTTTINLTHQFTLHKHPQASSRGIYCNVNPYTEIELYCEPFGMIEVDTNALKLASTLDVDLRIDVTNGIGLMTLSTDDYIIDKISGQVGTPVTLSQVSKDQFGIWSNGINAVGGTLANLAMGNISGALISSIAGITSHQSLRQPKQSTIGSSGSFANYVSGIILQEQFFEMVEEDRVQNGRPLCKMIKPSNVGGYLLIQDGDIATSGTKQENQMIRSYLEGGFYYE